MGAVAAIALILASYGQPSHSFSLVMTEYLKAKELNAFDMKMMLRGFLL